MTAIKPSMVSIRNVLLSEISASRFLCNQRSQFSVEGLTAYRYGSTHSNIITNPPYLLHLYFILCSFPCSRALRGSSGFSHQTVSSTCAPSKPRRLSFPLYSKPQPASAIYSISLRTPLMSYNPINSLHQCNPRLINYYYIQGGE